jgi:predicted GNAT family acetyltransferase
MSGAVRHDVAMANSEVEVTNNSERKRYEARVRDELAGFATYELREGIIRFVHTEVEDAFEGHGVGSTLARAALDDVRRDGSRKVIASCPFIKEWIEQHPDYQDLLA